MASWELCDTKDWVSSHPVAVVDLWSYRNISRVLPAVSDDALLAWGMQADILLNQGGTRERNSSEK